MSFSLGKENSILLLLEEERAVTKLASVRNFSRNHLTVSEAIGSDNLRFREFYNFRHKYSLLLRHDLFKGQMKLKG